VSAPRRPDPAPVARPRCQSANFRLPGESDHPLRPNWPTARSGDGMRKTVDNNVSDRRGRDMSAFPNRTNDPPRCREGRSGTV
jgi:hypothetical protein